MPNENQNTGSFGAGLGGIDALKAAMQKRGIDASILDQVSASAPTGASAVAPNVPQDANNVMTQTASSAVGGSNSKTPFRSAESEISLKALRDVAKTEAKIAELSVQGI